MNQTESKRTNETGTLDDKYGFYGCHNSTQRNDSLGLINIVHLICGLSSFLPTFSVAIASMHRIECNVELLRVLCVRILWTNLLCYCLNAKL